MLLLMSTLAMVGVKASVLGIFENTNLPVGISSECGSVHRLEIVDNELYAATEKGIYKYLESDNSWTCWAMEDYNVLDFKANGDDIVAIVVPKDLEGFRAVEVAKIVRTNCNISEVEDIMDGGMGYSYRGKRLTYVMRLAQHPTKPATLMVAAHPGVWISEDFGTTWVLKTEGLYAYNENQFLGWHPLKENVLFYTSESPLFAAQIMRSENGGSDWDIIDPDPTGDNSCHHLAFDPNCADHILYSGEGCIFESNDCGKTWESVFRKDDMESDYIYNVMFDPLNVNTVYAVGCRTLSNEIRIFMSSDNGKSWACVAVSDSFNDLDYWVHESVLFNGKIFIYTHSGVLAYELDDVSAISDAQAGEEDESAPVYDVLGRKVRNMQSGNLYIKRGGKFIAR